MPTSPQRLKPSLQRQPRPHPDSHTSVRVRPAPHLYDTQKLASHIWDRLHSLSCPSTVPPATRIRGPGQPQLALDTERRARTFLLVHRRIATIRLQAETDSTGRLLGNRALRRTVLAGHRMILYWYWRATCRDDLRRPGLDLFRLTDSGDRSDRPTVSLAAQVRPDGAARTDVAEHSCVSAPLVAVQMGLRSSLE